MGHPRNELPDLGRLSQADRLVKHRGRENPTELKISRQGADKAKKLLGLKRNKCVINLLLSGSSHGRSERRLAQFAKSHSSWLFQVSGVRKGDGVADDLRH